MKLYLDRTSLHARLALIAAQEAGLHEQIERIRIESGLEALSRHGRWKRSARLGGLGPSARTCLSRPG
jgi:hypothetical protein